MIRSGASERIRASISARKSEHSVNGFAASCLGTGCVISAGEQKLLVDQTQAASTKPGFEGTPGFLINNQTQVETLNWAMLKPKLDALLR